MMSGLNIGVSEQARNAEARITFDKEFSDFSNPQSIKGRVIFASIRRVLRQFRLHKLYDEAFLLNEAYIRAIACIRRGLEIRNASAWLRGTIFRIVRELSREQQRTIPLEETFWDIHTIVSPDEDLQDELLRLSTAIQLLSLQDQELLQMKVVENLSWTEIREIWKTRGYGDCAEATLRKRKERALSQLRKIYYASE